MFHSKLDKKLQKNVFPCTNDVFLILNHHFIHYAIANKKRTRLLQEFLSNVL